VLQPRESQNGYQEDAILRSLGSVSFGHRLCQQTRRRHSAGDEDVLFCCSDFYSRFDELLLELGALDG
jgi:hypothetical protein